MPIILQSALVSNLYFMSQESEYSGQSIGIFLKVNLLLNRVEFTFIKYFANSNHREGIKLLRPKRRRKAQGNILFRLQPPVGRRGRSSSNSDSSSPATIKVFIPDYNVSVAELVISGSDLSQHISTAGHEASGTGSMKFLMNGCLLLATADGSTNEIIEEIGAENMFIFGAKINEVPALCEKGSTIKAPLQFVRVVRMVRDGYFGFKDYFKSLCETVENGKDFYLLGSDFASYLEAQAAADRAYVNKEKWMEMSILCTAGSGRFSSDRTIDDYAEKTWGIQPCKCPF